MTQTGKKGTPTHMAPEVITAKRVKRRKATYTPYDGFKADIYSFGVMLYEIATLGDLPYEAKSGADYMAQVVDPEVAPKQMPESSPQWLKDMYEACI